MGLSAVVLLVVLLAAAMGALALARQRPNPRLAARVPPAAWALEGHDAARTGHSLSYFTTLPITLVPNHWRQIPPIGRAPIIDGYGNVYLARPDGALLALNADFGTSWCAALQPITDTSCTGPAAETPPSPLPPGVLPNAIIGPDGYHVYIYVVGEQGVLRVYDRSSPYPLWHKYLGLVPDDGVVFGPDPGIMYGVIPAGPQHGLRAYAVVALRWPGVPSQGWRTVPIVSRGLSPPAIAPGGAVLVSARSSRTGRPAMLYALSNSGEMRWRVALAPGRPSAVAIEGKPNDWVAWAVVVGATRSWLFVVDHRGRLIWRWSTGHPLSVTGGVVALAHPARANPLQNGLGYVGSPVGIYAFDLRLRHAWLFSDTRTYGPTGAPVTDYRDTVYFATASGQIFDVWQNGTLRWRYDTHRTAPGPLALYPDGSVFVTTRDANGMTVAEKLGTDGVPLAAGAYCADPDCPSPTPTPSATTSLSPVADATAATPTSTPSPTALAG